MACVAASVVWSASSVSVAQTENARQAAIRRTMIENAQRAQTAGQFAQCVELSQRAASIQDTGSLRRLLAECQLSAGMVVEAIGNGETCLAMLRRDERAVGRDAHMAACERVAREGRARTTQLVVRTPTPEPRDLRVTVSGHALDRVEWNIATLAVAGPLVIEATAEGMQPFRRNVDAASGAMTEVRIELVPVAPSQTSNTQSNPQGDTRARSSDEHATSQPIATPRVDPSVSAPPSRRAPSPLLVAGGVTVGVGVVGTVVGFSVPAALVAAFDARCGVNAVNLPPAYESCQAEARAGQGALDALSAVGFTSIAVTGVGAALLIVGVVGASPERSRASSVALLPVFGRSSQELRLSLRW